MPFSPESCFSKAADLVGLGEDTRRILSSCANEIAVHFPVKTDDGRVEMFHGFRVQHNYALGPFLGGLRYHPSVDLKTMRNLAARRTWQAALVGIPFGGAMGGIRIEPFQYTLTELERITRRFVFALGNNIGPEYDILAPDVNTNAQIMSWILDTYSSTVPPQDRNRSLHVVTGKPVEAGGSLGRDKAVGQGIVYLIQQWGADRDIRLDGMTYMLQGFGGVGSWVARLMSAEGARLVAVEDVSGAVANPEGIAPEDLILFSRRHGGIHGYPKAQAVSHEEYLKTPAMVWIPVAVENQLTAETKSLLSVRLVVEGACCPMESEGDTIFQERGIDLIPDILGNAGGAIVSYFEWVQNRRGEHWQEEDVDAGLKKRVLASYRAASDKARDIGVSLRVAAMALAIAALDKVYKERGIFP
jgi:glutamate dehydrogenase (NAD(P)+)